MALRDNELARLDGTDSTLELREQPSRARWSFDDLLSADGNTLRCAFTCSVRPLPEHAERQALQEVLMGPRRSVTVAEVITHFAPTLRAAANDAAKAKGAEAWVASGGSDDLAAALKQAAIAVAFSCGLEVLAPYQIELESPSYQQQRLRDVQRVLAERQAAGQVEHLARAAELLKRFQELRQAAPDLPAGRILEQVSPADRGQMLQSLLLASASRGGSAAAADLWAVAGPYLVKIDTRAAPFRPALMPLPPTLGPLRSVQPAVVRGERVLLVGARSGFMVVRPDGKDEPATYSDPMVESQLGFSRVVYQGDSGGSGAATFTACHGEAGIVRWTAGRAGQPVSSIRPDRFATAAAPAATSRQQSSDSISGSVVVSRTPGPRNLQALDERCLVFSVANRIWILDGEDLTTLPAETEGDVIAIVPDAGGDGRSGGRMFVVHDDGMVCTLDGASGQISCRERRGGRYRAAAALPWMGGSRLLLAADEGAVECVGADDALVTQFVSPHRGLRVVAASASLVAGVSADRQRLILWNAWEGRQPLPEVYLTGLTHHRIADLQFA